MLRRLPFLVLRYGPPFFVVAALLAYPLWLYRNAYAEGWPQLVAATGGVPGFMDGINAFEARVIGFAWKLVAAVVVLSFLPAFVLSRLARVRHAWVDALAIGMPHAFYGSLIGLTLGFVLGVGSGLVGVGLLGIDSRYAIAFGVALPILWSGERPLRGFGTLVRNKVRGADPNDWRRYRFLVTLVVFPLLFAYITAAWWVPELWQGRLVADRQVAEAFTVVAVAESICLALMCLVWAAVWHVCHGPEDRVDPETLVEAFA
ncbi:MAG: hypothetical protein QNJ98_02195 [Planctomycetota bacterium]|nr:hypothetical protein [Planctomycetota bacterium]